MFTPWIPHLCLLLCYISKVHKVRLSLLTMTNPNQMREVLLFACYKMADETNLSSKVLVADSTREI